MTKSDNPAGATKYRLKFLPAALKEWSALDGSVKEMLVLAVDKREDMAAYRSALERLLAAK